MRTLGLCLLIFAVSCIEHVTVYKSSSQKGNYSFVAERINGGATTDWYLNISVVVPHEKPIQIAQIRGYPSVFSIDESATSDSITIVVGNEPSPYISRELSYLERDTVVVLFTPGIP